MRKLAPAQFFAGNEGLSVVTAEPIQGHIHLGNGSAPKISGGPSKPLRRCCHAEQGSDVLGYQDGLCGFPSTASAAMVEASRSSRTL